MPDNQPHVTKIWADDGRLYAATPQVEKLPVYVFAPLVSYPDGLSIAFVDHWRSPFLEYIEDFRPIALPADHPKDTPGTFWSRDRNRESSRRPWGQAVYGTSGGGFPLYIRGDGSQGDPGTPPGNPGRPIFIHATIDLRDGPVYSPNHANFGIAVPPGIGP